MKANSDIRNYAKKKGVLLWEIAYRLDINDGNFSRRLRRELSAEEKSRIRAIINSVAAQKEAEANANNL